VENKNTSDKVLSLTGVFFSYLHFATFFPLESLPIKNKPDNKYYYLNNPSYFYHFFINFLIFKNKYYLKYFYYTKHKNDSIEYRFYAYPVIES
jgi:hypothetical protein